MPAEILQQNGRNLAFGKPYIIIIILLTTVTLITDNRGQIKEANNKPGQLMSGQQAAINLPASLFNHVTMPSVGMFFGLYENATLFPVGGASTDSSASRQPQVCSHILSATVGQNIDFRELNSEDSVMLTFRLDDKLPGVVSL